jgi:predicted kinase
MKSLSLTKPLVLLMVGHPGSGKSFFARQFSETFGAPTVNFNRMRYELFSQPQYSQNEQAVIQNIANYQIEELLKTQRTFIVDGGMNPRADRQKLHNAAKEAGYGTLAVWVQTDLATCKQRSLKRNSQQADDKYAAPITEDQFDLLVKRLTAPNQLEQSVVISGKHTYSTQARTVLKKLVAPREEAEKNSEKSRPQQPASDLHRRRLNVTSGP